MEEVRVEPAATVDPPIIWTDAKATEDRAWIGGYLGTSDESMECPWFSCEVTEGMAPWLKCRKGSPKRVIAGLELLATIIAVKLWAPAYRGRMVAKIPARTDNLSNEFAVDLKVPRDGPADGTCGGAEGSRHGSGTEVGEERWKPMGRRSHQRGL